MLIHKTTIGFVTQVYDTDSQRFIRQDFIAGDDVSYETPEGEPIAMPPSGVIQDHAYDHHLPLEMKQPDETSAEERLREIEEVLTNSKDMTSLCKDILDILNTNC
jgi:hypothetical protein